ncbi:outer membrane lipoprotein carrier protein LolA [uncultured Desulfobulbus sp.]|uniref:outer membrane lipoprotein carrier protein LolA n=1 Tax=uncultured Desulfobulbus sp. TaxID=239745 RepID=UPI0029C793B3|nr:outer membrane lipoprotein carrier protein LolA [uncultured Desulfobulbus sp.]
MRTHAFLCLLLSLFLGTTPVWGNPTGGPAVRLRSVQADFTQEKHLKILARPLVSQGIFAFQTPQSLRWEYLRPLHSILLLHEGRMRKLIEREGGFEQDNGAGIDAMRVVLQDIGSWLDGRFADNPLFQVTRAGERTVVLTPKEQGLQAVISRIELQLGPEEGVMEQVTIFEGPESFTRLRFTNTVLNREIPAGTFTQP